MGAIAPEPGQDALRQPGSEVSVEVAWNPEFPRESCAVQDMLRPDRIVAGATSRRAADLIREIYQPIADAGESDDTVEFVIAVEAPAKDVQREIDLRRRAPVRRGHFMSSRATFDGRIPGRL